MMTVLGIGGSLFYESVKKRTKEEEILYGRRGTCPCPFPW
jgi:hypothetical protein